MTIRQIVDSESQAGFFSSKDDLMQLEAFAFADNREAFLQETTFSSPRVKTFLTLLYKLQDVSQPLDLPAISAELEKFSRNGSHEHSQLLDSIFKLRLGSSLLVNGVGPTFSSEAVADFQKQFLQFLQKFFNIPDVSAQPVPFSEKSSAAAGASAHPTLLNNNIIDPVKTVEALLSENGYDYTSLSPQALALVNPDTVKSDNLANFIHALSPVDPRLPKLIVRAASSGMDFSDRVELLPTSSIEYIISKVSSNKASNLRLYPILLHRRYLESAYSRAPTEENLHEYLKTHMKWVQKSSLPASFMSRWMEAFLDVDRTLRTREAMAAGQTGPVKLDLANFERYWTLHPYSLRRFMSGITIKEPNYQFLVSDNDGAVPPVADLPGMVEAYFESYFLQKGMTDTITSSFTPSDIHPLFARIMLQNGGTVALPATPANEAKWIASLPDYEYRSLVESSELTFASAANRSFFRAGQPVSLSLHVKNIPLLRIKAFRLNIEAYFNKHGRAPNPTDLNLDGLDGFAHEETHSYEAVPPVRRQLLTYSFPQLTQPGEYIIEFIGRGTSSRAHIRIESLTLMEKLVPKGHLLCLLDSDGAIVKPTREAPVSVKFAGVTYRAASSGDILIPFGRDGSHSQALAHSESHGGGGSGARRGGDGLDANIPSSWPDSRERPVIASELPLLQRGDHFQVAASSFTRLAENYELSIACLLPRESLMPHTMASLVVRPVVRVGGCQVPVPLDFFRAPVPGVAASAGPLVLGRLVICAQTADGNRITTQYSRVRLSSTADLVRQFRVPPNLISVDVRLVVELRALCAVGSEEPIRLAASQSIEVSSSLSQQAPIDFFLLPPSQLAPAADVFAKTSDMPTLCSSSGDAPAPTPRADHPARRSIVNPTNILTNALGKLKTSLGGSASSAGSASVASVASVSSVASPSLGSANASGSLSDADVSDGGDDLQWSAAAPLPHVASGYRLAVLGPAGEALPNVTLSLWLTTTWCRYRADLQPFHRGRHHGDGQGSAHGVSHGSSFRVAMTLVTDEAGTVALGPLAGVLTVEVHARCSWVDGYISRTFALPAAQENRMWSTSSNTVVVAPDEVVDIPIGFAGTSQPLHTPMVSLFSTSLSHRALPLVNWSKAVRVGLPSSAALLSRPMHATIDARGLPPGRYQLFVDGQLARPVLVAQRRLTVGGAPASAAGTVSTTGTPVSSQHWLDSHLVLENDLLFHRRAPRDLVVRQCELMPDGQSMQLHLGNVTPATRVHVVFSQLASEHASTELSTTLPAVPTHSSDQPSFKPTGSFASNRSLGDETVYVMSRQKLGSSPAPGSMLRKPHALVNPVPLKETSTKKDEVRDSSAYREDVVGVGRQLREKAARVADDVRLLHGDNANTGDFLSLGFAGRHAHPVTNLISPSHLAPACDFLAPVAVTLTNLRPCLRSGRLVIPLPPVSNGACPWTVAEVLAADTESTASLRVALQQGPRPAAGGVPSAVAGGLPATPATGYLFSRDVRFFSSIPRAPVAPGQEAEAHLAPALGDFVIDRKVSLLTPAAPAIQVSTSALSSYRLLSTLDSVVSLLRQSRSNLPPAADGLLTRMLAWPALTTAQKRHWLSKHASHELHLFIWRRDRVFFEEHVRPLLVAKVRHTFIDRWLLDESLEFYTSPVAMQSLNVFELLLLGFAESPGHQVTPEQRLAALRRVELLAPETADPTQWTEHHKMVLDSSDDIDDLLQELLGSSELDTKKSDAASKDDEADSDASDSDKSTDSDSFEEVSSDDGDSDAEELNLDEDEDDDSAGNPFAVSRSSSGRGDMLMGFGGGFMAAGGPPPPPPAARCPAPGAAPPPPVACMAGPPQPQLMMARMAAPMSLMSVDAEMSSMPTRSRSVKSAGLMSMAAAPLRMAKKSMAATRGGAFANAMPSYDEMAALSDQMEVDQDPSYESLDVTRQYGESEYFACGSGYSESLIGPGIFWADYARHGRLEGFLSGNFLFATGNVNELLLVLFALDLPLGAALPSGSATAATAAATPVNIAVEGALTHISSSSPVIAFHLDLVETGRSPAADATMAGATSASTGGTTSATAAGGASPIFMVQRFIDPTDSTIRLPNGLSMDRTETGPFIVGRIYRCFVIMINMTSASVVVNPYIELPDGSMPISSLISNLPITLYPYQAHRTEFTFYFPRAGRFAVYPAHVSLSTSSSVPQLLGVAPAEPRILDVVDSLQERNARRAALATTAAGSSATGAAAAPASWATLCSDANTPAEEILAHLRREDVRVNQLNMGLVFWRLGQDINFFRDFVAALRDAGHFDANVWRFALTHLQAAWKANPGAGAAGRAAGQPAFLVQCVRDLLEQSHINRRLVNSLRLVTLETPILRHRPMVDMPGFSVDVYDYSPLVNPRSHQFGSDRDGPAAPVATAADAVASLAVAVAQSAPTGATTGKHFGAKHINILNDSFRGHYHRFISYLAALNRRPTVDEWLVACCYPILQDRIEAARDVLTRFIVPTYRPEAPGNSIQLDYLVAYLDLLSPISEGDSDGTRALTFPLARQLANKHADCPALGWQKHFADISQYLDEVERDQQLASAASPAASSTKQEGAPAVAVADGGEGQPSDAPAVVHTETSHSGADARNKRMTAVVDAQPVFSFTLVVDSYSLRVTHRGLKAVRVRYFPINTELMFSQEPFAAELSGQGSGGSGGSPGGESDNSRPTKRSRGPSDAGSSDTFAAQFVMPAHEEILRLDGGAASLAVVNTSVLPLAERYRSSNFVIEVAAMYEPASTAPLLQRVASLPTETAFYSSSVVAVQLSANYGQLLATNQVTGRALRGAYCKVYAMPASGGEGGKAKFVKDGYTDLRGRFDYASVSTMSIKEMSRLAIFVSAPGLGAHISHCLPPRS
ncbi:hypothetical protein H696_05095 [Fonticula alba]|uniref:Uncharacterized protein n=1 Tax=Fonticula alba TaxID=691883 RepID=A0A058Z3R8_FONAL|nr:hypothetical protein H696_05095 [Fonticula alba]KCV68167.1 hypothetical protein H696_05095 [Fonticula alba]|eukprot:XP_009497221.1 hypothetical protein H696_05095 [Fonticula alba]